MEQITPEIRLQLQDNEWPLEYIDHDRQIARAIGFDEAGYFYFVRVQRDDAFGKATLIETAGGGVESGEDLYTAIARELREELACRRRCFAASVWWRITITSFTATISTTIFSAKP